mgnify:CR=1 FL=1
MTYIKCTGYGRCYKTPVVCVRQSSVLFGGDDVCDWLYAMEVMAKARPIAKAVDVL